VASSFPVYAAAWIDERPGLRPKTLQPYRYLLRAHLKEAFGSTTIAGITEADVRRWRAGMLSAGVTPVTAAKAHRLLKAIMATAVMTAKSSGIRAVSKAHRSRSRPNGQS
jgi:hypothetical protein